MDAYAMGHDFAKAMDRRDLRGLARLLHPDFRMVHQGLPADLDRSGFLRWMATLEHAFPDWDMHIHDLRADGDHAHFGTRIEATHRSALDMQEFGGRCIAPTWRRVRIPDEPITVRVKDGRVVEMRVQAVPGGGIQGILGQIGERLPQAMADAPTIVEVPPPLVEFQEG